MYLKKKNVIYHKIIIHFVFYSGRDGGPSILDGPAAIARLIDRTRHSDRDNFPGSVHNIILYSR